MADEKVSQNGAADASQAQRSGVKMKRETRRNLVGKIARLPDNVREQLNQRLRDNERSAEILAWLNELSRVKKIMAEQFGGKLINHRNLSQWRQGGFQNWLEKQERVMELRALAKETKALTKAGSAALAQGAATMASARMFKMVRDMSEQECTPENMARISHATTQLVYAEAHPGRMAQEKIRVHLRNEEVTLHWDKHQRDVAEIAERILSDHEAKTVHRSSLNRQAKLELIGYRLYNDLWIPRVIPMGDAPVSK
jgi:hypothetical protein